MTTRERAEAFTAALLTDAQVWITGDVVANPAAWQASGGGIEAADLVTRLAAAIEAAAAEEREACARAAAALAVDVGTSDYADGWRDAAGEIAAAIRFRGTA